MRLESIALQNFGPYADVTLDLRHVSSATVSGPNGGGKSTLVSDGVLWVLLDKCRTGIDELIRLGTTDAAGTVIFTSTGQRYRADRTRSIRTKRGRSDFRLTVQNGDSWVPVERSIEKILNADYDVVTASNFIVQDDPFDLCKAKPSQRIGLLSDILDIAKYANYAKTATRQGNLAEGELVSMVGQAEEKRQAAETYRLAVTQLAAVECQLQTLNAQIEQAQVDLDQAIREKAKLEASIQAMPEENIDYLETQVSVLEHSRDRLQVKIEELEALAAREPELVIIQDQLSETVRHREQLKRERVQARDALGQSDVALQDAQAKGSDLQARRAELGQQRVQIEAEMVNLRNRISEYEQVIAHDAERAEIAGKLHGAEQRKADRAEELQVAEREFSVIQGTHGGRVRHHQERKDELAKAVQKMGLVESQCTQWAQQYARETTLIEANIATAEEQAALLTTVPCDEGLQRKCRFVKSAMVTKENDLPMLRTQWEQRETDPKKILALAPYDIKSPDDEVVRLSECVNDALTEMQESAQNEGAANGIVLGIREHIKRLDQECSDLRKSLPDAAYLQKAHADLPRLREGLVLKGQALGDVMTCHDAVEQDMAGVNLQEKKEARADANENLAKLDDRLHQHEATISCYELKLADLPKVQHAQEVLPDIQRDWETKLAELATAQQALQHAQTHTERKQELNRQLTEITEQHELMHAALAEYQGQCQVCVEHRASAKATIAQTCRAETELQTIEKRVGELKAAVQEYSWLAEAYKRVPVLMIDNAIPVVEREANLALHQLSARGMTLRFETQKALKTVDKLVDELNIIVRDQVGERSYESYSGGERGLANFATRLGLSALTSTRSGARIETMVIDEAFSSLDESVSERMRAFLGTLPEKFPLVLVISHDQNFTGTLGSKIMVIPGPDGSTVEVM